MNPPPPSPFAPIPGRGAHTNPPNRFEPLLLTPDPEDEESTPHHLIADEFVFHPDVSICRSQLQVLVRELLSNVLDPQEKEIIEMRFDLNETGDDVSAAEIGRRLGLKPNAARNLVTRILAKIRDALQEQGKALAF